MSRKRSVLLLLCDLYYKVDVASNSTKLLCWTRRKRPNNIMETSKYRDSKDRQWSEYHLYNNWLLHTIDSGKIDLFVVYTPQCVTIFMRKNLHLWDSAEIKGETVNMEDVPLVCRKLVWENLLNKFNRMPKTDLLQNTGQNNPSKKQ